MIFHTVKAKPVGTDHGNKVNEDIGYIAVLSIDSGIGIKEYNGYPHAKKRGEQFDTDEGFITVAEQEIFCDCQQ